MRISLLLLLLSFASALAQKKIDLVKYGSEVFHTVGCAECHSEIKDDTAVKTGPGLYGLFQKDSREREVLAGGERHKQSIQADFEYFQQSLRKPNEDLAIAESGTTKGQPYLPVMPPYDKSVLSDFKLKAIHQHLLTLNEEGQRGPAKVMVQNKSGPKVLNPLADANEILVTDRTRIYRTRIKGQSARAVYVGTTQGLNYAFEPATLSIERIWWGGFVNIAGSLDGRGAKPSRLGHNALEVELKAPLLAPLHPKTSEPIDLTFKSPRMQDFKTISQTLHSTTNFANQLAKAGGQFLGYTHEASPTFQFQVGDNLISQQLTVSTQGSAKITLTGKLTRPQTFRLAPLIKGQAEDWTIDSLPAELTFTLPTKPAWRPSDIENTLAQPLQTSLEKKVRLPKGYQALAVAAPLDPHGRPQLFEPLGMAEGSDEALIVATRTAGIWELKDQTWTLLAEGLQDCLGVVREADGSLVIGQKPELTRLRDTDGDGWYDHYQALSEAFLSTTNYHEYLHGPVLGSDGNYYFSLNLTHHKETPAIYKAGGLYMGTQGGYRGWAMQTTPEGQTTPFANGLRSPAGLATGPDGKLYYTENQGEYVGTSKLFLLEKDKFYGHPSGLVDLPNMTPDSSAIQWENVKAKKEKALALLPHSRLANAPGSPAWHPETKEMFVGDQTLSTLFRIHPKPHHEAALIPFADGFPSGLMRLNFRANGDLIIGQTGRGWRAKGGSKHALAIIKRTESSFPNQLQDITREGDSFLLHFTQPLTETPSKDQLTLGSWTYLDAPKYGSPENNKTNHAVKSLTLSQDAKTLTLETDSIPKDQKNRVFLFSSKTLPATKGKEFEAFYSITGE